MVEGKMAGTIPKEGIFHSIKDESQKWKISFKGHLLNILKGIIKGGEMNFDGKYDFVKKAIGEKAHGGAYVLKTPTKKKLTIYRKGGGFNSYEKLNMENRTGIDKKISLLNEETDSTEEYHHWRWNIDFFQKNPYFFVYKGRSQHLEIPEDAVEQKLGRSWGSFA